MLFASLALLSLKPLLLGLGLIDEAILEEPLVWPKTAVSWSDDASHLLCFLVEEGGKFAEPVLMLMVFKRFRLGPERGGETSAHILYLYFVKPGA